MKHTARWLLHQEIHKAKSGNIRRDVNIQRVNIRKDRLKITITEKSMNSQALDCKLYPKLWDPLQRYFSVLCFYLRFVYLSKQISKPEFERNRSAPEDWFCINFSTEKMKALKILIGFAICPFSDAAFVWNQNQGNTLVSNVHCLRYDFKTF